MEIGEMIGNINYWAVLVAALSSFLVGSIWYGPFFGKTWMRLNGFTEEQLKQGTIPMPTILIINYLATVLSALALALFLGEESNASFGIFAGVIIAIFWIGTNRINDMLYEMKSMGLYLINLGYNLLTYAIMGAIIGVWH